jgi:hypothetical protein
MLSVPVPRSAPAHRPPLRPSGSAQDNSTYATQNGLQVLLYEGEGGGVRSSSAIEDGASIASDAESSLVQVCATPRRPRRAHPPPSCPVGPYLLGPCPVCSCWLRIARAGVAEQPIAN